MSDVVHLAAAVAPGTRASVSTEPFHMGKPRTTLVKNATRKRERDRGRRTDAAVQAQEQAQEVECRRLLRTDDAAAFQVALNQASESLTFHPAWFILNKYCSAYSLVNCFHWCQLPIYASVKCYLFKGDCERLLCSVGSNALLNTGAACFSFRWPMIRTECMDGDFFFRPQSHGRIQNKACMY